MPTQDSVDPIMKKRVMNGAEYAYVRIEGEFHSLGRWGTRDSIARFEKVLAEWRATIIGREQPTDRILTVGELAENYLQHETDRRDAGEVTRSTWYAARNAMLVLVESHAGTPAVRFGPKALKSIQTSTPQTALRVGSSVRSWSLAFPIAVSKWMTEFV